MRILIADDDRSAREMTSSLLQLEGYDVTTACDGKKALEQLRTGKFQLLISDWEMPGMSGVELCREVRQRGFANYIYVILLTSRSATRDIVEGMDAGADDFLVKPVELSELAVRLRAARRLLSIEGHKLTIFALAKLAESRDPETGSHLERMREYARILADKLSRGPKYGGTIDGDYIQMLYMTAPLHDIGKVAIPDHVLLKPGKLSVDEYEIMKEHPNIGAVALEMVIHNHPDAMFLRMAHELTRTHHERYDGSGYPAGLSGEEIPLCGRIVAVADVYDALTSDRVYRRALGHEEARQMIIDENGSHFDPDVVQVFIESEEDFLAVRADITESSSVAAMEGAL